MYKTKTFKDFAIGLGVIGAIGGGAYIWNYTKQTGFKLRLCVKRQRESACGRMTQISELQLIN
ncbi:hypothetical protein J4454_02945 [Candidatus Pacearchaeota archaeon]|nr:hypothetical protein [Candidatus Pacearchaeota archaeon]